MDRRDLQAPPRFTQPVRQVVTMLVVLAFVGLGVFVGYETIREVFLTGVYLNIAISIVFVIGVLSCFHQVIMIMQSVSWIETFARAMPGQRMPRAPSLLAPLSALLRTPGARIQLTSTSTRSILDSVATRVDEDQEVTRYLTSVLILLGLLGTFYGLATSVPGLVDTIRGLAPAPGETGADIFGRLQSGLETQLGGMGHAFSSSLFGLSGSLILGLLELFAGHGQGRFYRELEEWLSSMTRVGVAGEEGGMGAGGVLSEVVDVMAEQMEGLQRMFTQSEIARAQTDRRLGDLAIQIGQLAQKIEERDTLPALARLGEGQERMIGSLDRLAQQLAEGGTDPESRMRLRSIDVQMLRILEEISAGRQESMAELRADLASLGRSLRSTVRPGTETR